MAVNSADARVIVTIEARIRIDRHGNTAAPPNQQRHVTVAPIALDKLPAAVTKAFAAHSPKAKASAAEQQVVTDKGTRYELAFSDGGKRKEATFQADGSFVEEECRPDHGPRASLLPRALHRGAPPARPGSPKAEDDRDDPGAGA